MRKSESRETDVFVVEIGAVGLGNVFPINSHVYPNARRAGKPARRLDNVTGYPFDHWNQVGQRNRRNHAVVSDDIAVGKSDQLRPRINRSHFMVKVQSSEWYELLKVRDETSLRGITEMRDVMY